MHYIYLIKSVDGENYIGCTGDLRRRVYEHQHGLNKSTKGRQWTLVYYEAYANKSSATKREHRLKQDGRSRYQLMKRVEE